MGKRSTIIGAVILVVIIGLALFIYRSSNTSTPVKEQVADNLVTFKDDTTGLSFQYSDFLAIQQLTDADKKDKFITRLISIDPASIVSIRYEEGLRSVTSISGQSLLDLLSGNIAKAYPNRYPGYKLLSEKSVVISSLTAKQIVFSYTGPSGEVAKQKLVILPKDGNTAFYISFQATETEFENLDTLYFTKILESIII